MMRNDRIRRTLLAGIGAFLLLAGACGGSESTTVEEGTSGDAASPAAINTPGIRLISPEDGAAVQADPPGDLVILDVRTPEEFAEGHLEGAVMIDFYREDFTTALADLDPDAPYVIYCRSGNRSGQTRALMEELGFTDVADIDGGIIAWNEAGLGTVAP